MNELFRRILFLPPQSSTVAEEIDQLHYWVISVTMAGASLVAGVAAYFILRYRRRPVPSLVAPNPSPVPLRPLMAFWFELAVIAFLLALFVGWWVIGFRQFVRLETPPPNSIVIYVTAKQWMWSFAYPNGRTSNVALYVPAHHPVKLVLSSRDVIHSFYVPHFRVKKDVLPGRTTALWFEAKQAGVYPVYCTEYCGEGHSTMRAEVVALEEQAYWAKLEQLPRLDVGGPDYVEPAAARATSGQLLTLAEMGERVAVMKGCMRCHTADGTPHLGPSWSGVYGSRVNLTDGTNVAADGAYLTESMMDPRAKLRAGFQPIMPSYQGMLGAAEVGALLEYMRHLSTRPEAARLSPLAPPGSPARVELPRSSTLPLDPHAVPLPLGGATAPRSDTAPYSPYGTEPSHPNLENP